MRFDYSTNSIPQRKLYLIVSITLENWESTIVKQPLSNYHPHYPLSTGTYFTFFQLLTFGRKFPLVILANMDSTSGISAFIDSQISLLQQERDTEVEESNLLLSNCAPKLLEKKGLALLNLSVANVQVGLGGRR